MSIVSKAAVALSAALLFSPAPAMAAAAGHHPSGHDGHGHNGTRHQHAGLAGRKRPLHAQLAELRHRVDGLGHTLSGAAVTGHQQKVLADRFSSRDDIAGLQRALAKAHTRKQLAHVSAELHRLGALVPAQVELVRWVGEVDGGLHQWRSVQRRLDDDDQCVPENEEDPQLMGDLDTAVTDLTDAQETLSNDEQLLIAAAGEGYSALRDAMQQVVSDIDAVTGEVLDAVSALQDLESQLGK